MELRESERDAALQSEGKTEFIQNTKVTSAAIVRFMLIFMSTYHWTNYIIILWNVCDRDLRVRNHFQTAHTQPPPLRTPTLDKQPP